MSSVGHSGFYPALIFAWVSPFYSPTISVIRVPLPETWTLFFPRPLLKIVLTTLVAFTRDLNTNAYPDQGEVNASVKTTEGACRYCLWVCCSLWIPRRITSRHHQSCCIHIGVYSKGLSGLSVSCWQRMNHHKVPFEQVVVLQMDSMWGGRCSFIHYITLKMALCF